MRRASRLTGPESAIARNIAITIQAIGCHSRRTSTIVPMTVRTIRIARTTVRELS